MATPIMRGDWTINWSACSSGNMPHNLDELIYATSPDILGQSVQVDDFSARHNADGSICQQGVLEFIPYGQPDDVITSHVLDGDIAVYVTPKPSPFANNRDGAIAAVKQRGWHAELCHKKNLRAWNASVWTDVFKDRPISDLSGGEMLSIYRIAGPTGPIAQSETFCQSLHIWMRPVDSYVVPPVDFRWYLDPADFSSRDSLSRIAKALLSRPAGSSPGLSPVTCVQWVYTVFCLALLFPPSEPILKDLSMLDSYGNLWQSSLGDLIKQDKPFLQEVPFKPYSPAQMVQAFLNTYCGGVDLLFCMQAGGVTGRATLEQIIQGACPPEYQPLIQAYLKRVQETHDPTIQLDEAPHGFLMPSCFFCEERKEQRGDGMCWFDYVGTAMQTGLLTRRT